MANIIWSLLWLVLLIFIGIWVASVCSFFYILLSIFSPCIKPLENICDILLEGVKFAHTCSEGIVSSKPMF